MNSRLSVLSNWLDKNNLDFTFINSPSNIYYLSGYMSDPIERLLALIVFRDRDPILICPKLEEEEVKESDWQYEVLAYTDNEDPWMKIDSYFRKSQIKGCHNIGIEGQFITFERYQKLQSMFPNVFINPLDQQLNHMRLIKDEIEIENMRKAAELAEYSIKKGLEVIKEGCTEQEVASHIEYQQMKSGIQRKITRPLVLFGNNSSLPHGKAGNRKLKSGDFILIDLGVKFKEYCSDITRTYFFQRADEKAKELYETVLEANITAINKCKVGEKIGELDKVSRKIIERAGYGEYFPHRIGHGIGLEGHEYPSLNSRNNEILKTGMIFTIEPGIYIPHVGGIRIEDEVLITKNGPELLTSLSKKFTIIE